MAMEARHKRQAMDKISKRRVMPKPQRKRRKHFVLIKIK